MMLATVAGMTSFLGVFMIVMGLLGRRSDPVEARVRNLAAQFPDDEPGVSLSRPFVDRAIWPVLEGIAGGFSKLLPTTYVSRARHLLTLAGTPMSLTGFLLLTVAGAVGLPGLFVILVLTSTNSPGAIHVVGGLLLLGAGAYAPYFWLARRVSRRQAEVLKMMPNALDLVTTSVEAGLGLESAFAKVTESMKGPFPDEMGQALREMAMGASRRDALRAMGERTAVPEVITFVNAIIHAEITGSSIGDVLRVQADAMRMRRRQRVEQTAQKMPIWMTFPLIVFLLPSLFIALVGPAAITVLETMAGD
jgi:tight adherence protein C